MNTSTLPPLYKISLNLKKCSHVPLSMENAYLTLFYTGFHPTYSIQGGGRGGADSAPLDPKGKKIILAKIYNALDKSQG